MDGALPVSADHLEALYPERWELLKDVIVWLYMEQDVKLKLKDIVEIMQTQYKFYASEPQYKRQFGIWKVKRALPTAKKEKISKALETRAQQGKSSVVLHKGKVESQKIRRYMKEKGRREISLWPNTNIGAFDVENLSGHALQCGNRIFMNWSMPAAVLRFLKSKTTERFSPYASARTPMSDILVATPSSNTAPSPRDLPSPSNTTSPNNERSAMKIAATESLKISRAHLFAQGNHRDLLQGMNLQEQCITTEWLNQFWEYSFKTAKNWGRGPLIWNASNLFFSKFSESKIESFPGTPNMNTDASEQSSHHQMPKGKSPDTTNILKPSDLCRWSIHIEQPHYTPADSPESTEYLVDPNDERSWKPWATTESTQDFVQRLQESFESNDFSTIKTDNLPISSAQIVKAAKRSPKQLTKEALGFSIMARNMDLIGEMLSRIREAVSLHDLYPLHLASSYLDGSKSCCVVLGNILVELRLVRNFYINHLNHTVLDNLMIAILKGHTSCTPVMVDDAFRKEHRFVGEEVDICGRWDADSECIRNLNARGIPTIPQNWKHMFCHTSVQAITHCITVLFDYAADVNMPSGLFHKRCVNETCGLKLQLGPLHTLVVTTVYLAQLGSDGENLFGMVACLLRLLAFGVNPLLKAHVSLNALLDLDNDNSQQCSHSYLDPLELAQKIPWDLISKWPEERRIGWKIFCTIFRLSQEQWSPPRSKIPVNTSDSSHHDFGNIYDDFIEGGQENIAMTELRNRDIDVQNENGDEGQGQKRDMEHWEDHDLDEDEEEFCQHCHYHASYGKGQKHYFGNNKTLSTLWAAVQTELLTYRRLAESDPWISPNFDMKSVLESLEMRRDLSIGLVSKRMMMPRCECGSFYGTECFSSPRVENVSKYYFSNLEDYSRTTFLSE